MEFLIETVEKKFGQGKRNTILKKQYRERVDTQKTLDFQRWPKKTMKYSMVD